ncbi:hypothetical protein J6590_071488 [Homalodisca vitripennis]|nr:hypothetical protein J6590_071488 [Homalodisca vitripennis]
MAREAMKNHESSDTNSNSTNFDLLLSLKNIKPESRTRTQDKSRDYRKHVQRLPSQRDISNDVLVLIFARNVEAAQLKLNEVMRVINNWVANIRIVFGSN